MVYDTIPSLKLLDFAREFYYKTYRMEMDIPFKTWADGYFVCDLTKYYKWAKQNDMDIRHEMIKDVEHDRRIIVFGFDSKQDLMAFKLKWL